jgi:DNA (cytosine-5)-methyltransferase 1
VGVKPLKVADLFCGAGGASVSFRRATEALGLAHELLAVNHWPRAVETHRANHPEAVHLCEAVDKVDPKTKEFRDPLTGKVFRPNGRLDLLMAGPECTHHSTARGGRPMNDQSRHSAWHILKFAQELYIDNILIENVPEFRDWGPLGANGRPMKRRKGETYRAFLAALRSLGYTVDARVLNAADYGDPTTRRRLFIIAKRGNKPIHWPEPTHSRSGEGTLFGGRKRWRAAREVIDWSLKGQSIFHRKKPLSPKTMARILAGLEKFGGADVKPFLIVLRGTDARQIKASAVSLDEPLPVITTSGHVGLVDAEAAACIVPVTHGGGFERAHSVDDPMTTVTGAHRGELALAEASFMLVNNHNNAPKSLEDPVSTITGGSRLYKADAFVLQQQSGGVPRSTAEPLPTIATDGAQSLIEFEVKPEPFVVTMEHQGSLRSIDAPLPTITTARGGAFAVVEAEIAPEPFMVSAGGPNVDARPVSQPMHTVLTRDHIALVAAEITPEPFLVQPCHGGDDARRVKSVDEPLGTIPCSNRFAVVEAELQAVGGPFIVGAGGSEYAAKPKSVDDPMLTVTADDHHALVEPFLVPHYGERHGQQPRVHSVDEPVPTIPATGDGKFEVVQPEFITTYYGNGGITPVDEPVPTITTKDRCALVAPVINGRRLDIRLRMLKPHELAQAMSFSKDYQFTGNQGERVKQIGNAWPCALGEALITTILEDKAKRKRVVKIEGVA